LGLAKAVPESQFETVGSIPGSFAGTPEFASPEQFAGIGIDIRSDLYSLGATLWNMLAGQPPFRGTSAELMYQHLHATLPMGQLSRILQPVVALIEALLEKDPARRFQNPTELLKAMPMVILAVDGGRTIAAQDLRQMPLTEVASATHKPSTRRGPEKISVARLPTTASQVFGRDQDIAFLDAAWSDPQVNVVTIVAWAGVGKSTLVNHWLGRIAAEHYRSADLVFAGLSIDRAPVETFRRQMSFSTPLSFGSVIPTHGPERHGRRVKGWRSSLPIIGHYWFWMVWSRCKIHLVHKKGACVSLLSRHFCASLLVSTLGFA
jgi:hypothetical protein